MVHHYPVAFVNYEVHVFGINLISLIGHFEHPKVVRDNQVLTRHELAHLFDKFLVSLHEHLVREVQSEVCFVSFTFAHCV